MKVFAQKQGLATAGNMPAGFKEISGTRGESAYVFDMGEMKGAFVQEGLGTKSLVAQAVYQETKQSFFAAIAQDTVACIINDLVSVGATPVVLNAYWSSSSYEWLTDEQLAQDFITGWREACDKARVVWGGGETQALSGVVVPNALEFAGSAFGIIPRQQQLVQGSNLQAGDKIVLIAASGVHANGISLIRQLAEQLPEGYQTVLEDGTVFGEAVLTPTPLYAQLVTELFKAGVDVHYLSHITGHGWRKLMRADAQFTYRMLVLPPVQEIFNFVAKHANNDNKEMYGTYNMGAGYAVYVPVGDADKVVSIASQCGLDGWVAGSVEAGPKQVIIEPNGINYDGSDLELR